MQNIYNIINTTQFAVALAFVLFLTFFVKHIKNAFADFLNNRIIKLTEKISRSVALKDEAQVIYTEIYEKFKQQQALNQKNLADSTGNISKIINKLLLDHKLDLEYKLKEFTNKMNLQKSLVLQNLNNDFIKNSFTCVKQNILDHMLNSSNDLEVAKAIIN